MKLLVDMNLSPRWVTLLTNTGWEAIHWSTLGKYDAQDSEILAYAAANEYVVITHDLDFSAILAVTHGKKPSVVQLRTDDVGPEVSGPKVVIALRELQMELENGALLTIGPVRSRIRMLPLVTKDL
jgi:predicted nuclease of predicted toxin-antitoxin system